MRIRIKGTQYLIRQCLGIKYCVPLIAGMTLLLSSCQTAPKNNIKRESTKDIVSALGSVTEGLTNQYLTEEDLKKLAVQVQKDPEAQSALRSVNQALAVEQKGVKYCPIDGKRFSARLTRCPDHGVELNDVE